MTTPLLSYQLNPWPEPLMASPANPDKVGYNQSVLTLTASNATAADVTLNFLHLDLPLGSGAADLLGLLTLADLQAAVSVTPDPGWTLFQTIVQQPEPGGQFWASYVFRPKGSGVLPAGNSCSFTWQGVAPLWGVPINTVAGGPVGCCVTEGSAGSPTQVLPLEKATAGWFAPTLVATPEAVANGGTVQLTWNGPAGASYQFNGLAPGAPDQLSALAPGAPNPLPNAGTWASAPLTQDTVFTLNVSYTPPGEQPKYAAPQQTVTVAPEPLVITCFTGTMSWPKNRPQLTLAWCVSPATADVSLSCTSGKFDARGSFPITPTALQPLLTSYTLTATNAAGQVVTKSLVASFQPVHASPIKVGTSPVVLAFTPDSTQAWVSSKISDTTTILDTATYEPIHASPIPVDSVSALAFTPDGTQAWVANGEVTILDTATYQQVKSIRVAGGGPYNLAFTPDGRRAWSVNNDVDSIMVLDAATYQLLTPLAMPVGQAPWGLAFTLNGRQAWVANIADNTVTILDTATYQPIQASPVPVGAWPAALAFTPTGNQAWVVNAKGNNITILDTATYQPIHASPVPVGRAPMALAFTPDGRQAWVVNAEDNNVTVLDTATYQPVHGSPVRVGTWPAALAITPDGTQIWVGNLKDNTISALAITAYEPGPTT